MMTRLKLFSAGFIWFFGVLGNAASTNPICLADKTRWAVATDAEKLDILIKDQWEYWMREYPEWGTYVGRTEGNDSWTDYSPATLERRKKWDECFLNLYQKINKTKLNESELVSYLVALRKNKEIVDASAFFKKYLPIDQMAGIQIELVDTLEAAPQKNLNDFEDRLKRLEKVPILVDQIIDLMNLGIQKKVTHVKFLMEKVPGQIEQVMTPKVEDSPIYKSFAELKMVSSSPEKAQLLGRAQSVIEKKVYPAFDKLKKFLLQKYIPQCREKISMADLPQGAEWYKHQIRVETTTNLSAEEIHQMGLAEVARITQEMESVRLQVQFKGDLEDFKKFLSTDPQFFYTSAKELLMAYRDIAKRIDP